MSTIAAPRPGATAPSPGLAGFGALAALAIGTVAGGARRCLVTHAPQSSTATARATAT